MIKKMFLDAIKKPTLLVDLHKASANIAVMSAKAAQNRVVLRPHFKTHQSTRIAELYRDAGVSAITVSSVEMAQYFAAAGWHDILIAFPLNWREVDAVNDLAARIDLSVLVDCPESVDFLAAHACHAVGVWIKVDTGLHRAGIWWQEMQAIKTVAEKVIQSPNLHWKGILTHAGQTYRASSPEGVKERAFASKQAMLAVKQYLLDQGLENILISIGDTPGCRLLADFAGVDEIRPGNFIFFDLEQWQLGACRSEEIAVAVACPIVSKNRIRSELVIYGGAIHFAKETLQYKGRTIYGLVAGTPDEPFSEIQPDCILINTTQEHGIIELPPSIFSQYQIGDVITIFPVHACLTVQAIGEYTDIHSGILIPTMVTKRNGCL
jgi:D-serine deaminase-like pyridoxal phosphate-dependent protein